jgi:ABC-type uncharacterized transport system substrate-binding protein
MRETAAMESTPHSRASSVLRKLLIAFALTPAVSALADATVDPAPTIVVVTSSRVAAYQEALQGLRRELGPEQELAVVDLDEAGVSLSKELSQLNPRLVVAVGSAASRATAEAASVPFLVTMVVRSEKGASLAAPGLERRRIGVVSLDMPFGTVLREIHALFPDRTRIGVIYSKASSGLDESALQSEAAGQGFALRAVNCKGPEDVVDALMSLKHTVDIVWCPPDGTLFNATTVKPLIMASLRHQMLITGFSEGFVRAGTAVGVYPDFEAIGRQTGMAVRQYLNQGVLPGEQAASDARVAVNERILRLLGVQWMSPADQQGRLTVLK